MFYVCTAKMDQQQQKSGYALRRRGMILHMALAQLRAHFIAGFSDEPRHRSNKMVPRHKKNTGAEKKPGLTDIADDGR